MDEIYCRNVPILSCSRDTRPLNWWASQYKWVVKLWGNVKSFIMLMVGICFSASRFRLVLLAQKRTAILGKGPLKFQESTRHHCNRPTRFSIIPAKDSHLTLPVLHFLEGLKFLTGIVCVCVALISCRNKILCIVLGRTVWTLKTVKFNITNATNM